MGIADGVDEVHMATAARRVLRGYRPHEGNWPTEYVPARREHAWQRMRLVLDARPTSPARPRSTPPAGQPWPGWASPSLCWADA